jgi:hypothetical protein
MVRTIGPRAIDDIVPSLFSLITPVDDESSSAVLSGLREIVRVRSKDLLEYALNSLFTDSPITVERAKILVVIAEGSGSNLNNHFSTLIPQLTHELFIAAADAESDLDSSAKMKRFDAVKTWFVHNMCILFLLSPI